MVYLNPADFLHPVAAIMIATAAGFGVVGALVGYEQPALRVRLPGP